MSGITLKKIKITKIQKYNLIKYHNFQFLMIYY